MHSIRSGVAAALLAAGIVSMAAAADSAAPPPPPPPPDAMHEGHEGPRHMYDKLGLSADQQAKVDAVFAAKGPQLKNLHQQVRDNMEKIHALSPDDPNYGASVAQLAQTSGSLTTQLITAEADMRAQVFAILTPAQRTKMAAMHEGHREGGERWGRHGGHKPPPDAPQE